MSRTTPERLVLMANQIAANLAHTEDPAAATAEHIRSFWTPAMRATALATDPASLSPVAREALARLAA